jgi:hypothetical protein
MFLDPNVGSTATLVLVHDPNAKDKWAQMQVRISDCHGSVRLHRVGSKRGFVSKIRKLSKSLSHFANYLESQHEDT